jgi:hypothetical protein
MQKGSYCHHRFVVEIVADVVASTADVYDLTLLPELCRFLSEPSVGASPSLLFPLQFWLVPADIS